jgi:hypothetical protein
LQLLPGVEGTEERMGRAAQPYGSSGRRKSETGSAWRYQCWNSYWSWKPLRSGFVLTRKVKLEMRLESRG